MKLQIYISGLLVAIPENIEITFNFNNYFLQADREDSTYPMTLDLVANRHIFGFCDRINSVPLKKEYPAKVYYGPYLILQGRCVVTDVSETQIELFISTDKYSFWGGLKTSYLDELDLGGETYPANNFMLTAFDESFKQGNKDYVVFPLYQNPDSDVINNLNVVNGAAYTYTSGVATDSFIPFVRLHRLLEKIIRALGYQLTDNELMDDPGFKDVVLVSRRNSIRRGDGAKSFIYRDYVPHILIYDFLAEIERKFGCVFFVGYGDRTVSIKGYTRPVSLLELPVTNEIKKHFIEEDDFIKGIIMKDKDSEDKYVKQWKESLQIAWGEEEQAENVECVSNIIGSTYHLKNVDKFNLRWLCATVNDVYSSPEDYRKKIETEIRFTVFRPVLSKLPEIEEFQLFPSATPEPRVDADNEYNLLWKDVYNENHLVEGLFNKYHREKYNMIFYKTEEHTLTIHSDILILQKTNQIMSNDLVLRNRKYRCYEQEINLSGKQILSHILKCYPV